MLRKIPPSFVLLMCSVLTLSLTSLSSAELVALYQFEDNANDSSGNNLHGKFVGQAKIVSDAVRGNVLSLDGQDSYVDCGTAPAFNITSRITIACWVKVNKFDKNWQTIIAKGGDSYRLSRAGSTNSSHFGCTGLKIQWFDGNINVNDGKWHHIAGIYDGSMMCLYVDDVLDESRQTFGIIDISSYPLYIGASAQQGGERYFNGLIDDVAIFDHALNAEQVSKLYHHGAKSVSSTQEDIWSQVHSAISSIERGDVTAAEAVIERLLSESSQDKDIAPAVLQVAESLRKLGKSQKANELYQHVVRNWPNSSCALLLQTQTANLALERSDNPGLESAIDELLVRFAEHKDIAETIYRLISECSNKYWQFVESGTDDAEQIRFYDRIIRRLAGHILARQPDSDNAMWAQRAVALADIHIGNYEAAESSIAKLIANYPNHTGLPQALHWLGNDYHRMARYDEARQWYQYVIGRWPNDYFTVKSRAAIAVLDIDLDNAATADAALDKLIADFADYPDLLSETIVKIQEKYYLQILATKPPKKEDFLKPLKLWEKATTTLPDLSYDNPDLYYFIACCYYQLGEYEKSIEYYKTVALNWPNYYQAWGALSLIESSYDGLKKNSAIVGIEANMQLHRVFDEIIKSSPGSESARHACLKLGRKNFESGQWIDAARYFELFRENSSPDDGALWKVIYDLGMAYEEMGERDIAIEIYEVFLKTHPQYCRIKARLEELKKENGQ